MRISGWSSDVCSSDLRIYREYAASRSAQAIAAGLNADGIPGPKGKHWQHTTILGHRKRGTGVLNNELYVGVYVWNRQTFKTRHVNLHEMAEMGERCSRSRVARPNAPSEHVRAEPPELRILPHELCEARQSTRLNSSHICPS